MTLDTTVVSTRKKIRWNPRLTVSKRLRRNSGSMTASAKCWEPRHEESP